MSSNSGTKGVPPEYIKSNIFFLLFHDEKKQKSGDSTELAKKSQVNAKMFQFNPHKVRGRFDVPDEFTLSLISEGVRFLSCSESSRETF